MTIPTPIPIVVGCALLGACSPLRTKNSEDNPDTYKVPATASTLEKTIRFFRRNRAGHPAKLPDAVRGLTPYSYTFTTGVHPFYSGQNESRHRFDLLLPQAKDYQFIFTLSPPIGFQLQDSGQIDWTTALESRRVTQFAVYEWDDVARTFTTVAMDRRPEFDRDYSQ